MSSFSNVKLEFVKGDALDIAAEAKKHTPMVVEFWATVSFIENPLFRHFLTCLLCFSNLTVGMFSI